MSKKHLYKVIFHNQGKVYEIFARSVSQGGLYGFVEVEKIVFGEKSSIVVDPSEENLKAEFANVTRIHIPMHAVIRIDEVNKPGPAKVSEINAKGGNVTSFPVYTHGGEESKS